jgi:hypothetical protein
MRQPDNGRSRRLQSLVDGVAVKKAHPSCSAGGGKHDRSFHWSRASGQATPGGMTVATPFYIASIDKLWVAAVVLRDEEGLRRRDCPGPAGRRSDCLPQLRTRYVVAGSGSEG